MAFDPTEPRLLLFLSVDVENSTFYKNNTKRDEWPLTFIAFYVRFPEILQEQCVKCGRELPTLWKCLGDELVFFVRLRKSTAVLDYVRAFRAATNAYNRDLKTKSLKIRLKAAAWLAGFPVGNSEVHIPDRSRKNAPPRVDFIGPLMDIGFRISRLASRRRFIISVDLALMLLHDNHELKYFFDGRHALHGVRGEKEKGYPLISLDMLDEPKTSEDKLGQHPDPHVLKCFCEDFIAQSKGFIMRPFIERDPVFHQKPADWVHRYKAVCKALMAETMPSAAIIKGLASKPKKLRRPRRVKADSKRLLDVAKEYPGTFRLPGF